MSSTVVTAEWVAALAQTVVENLRSYDPPVQPPLPPPTCEMEVAFVQLDDHRGELTIEFLGLPDGVSVAFGIRVNVDLCAEDETPALHDDREEWPRPFDGLLRWDDDLPLQA
jgi:hypothetical protein